MQDTVTPASDSGTYSSAQALQEHRDIQSEQPKWFEVLLEQQRVQAEVCQGLWEQQRARSESHHDSLMQAIQESREVLQAQFQAQFRCHEHKPRAKREKLSPIQHATSPQVARTTRQNDLRDALPCISPASPPDDMSEEHLPATPQVAPAPLLDELSEEHPPTLQRTLAASSEGNLSEGEKAELQLPGALGDVQTRSHEMDPAPEHAPELNKRRKDGQLNAGLQEKVAGPLCIDRRLQESLDETAKPAVDIERGQLNAGLHEKKAGRLCANQRHEEIGGENPVATFKITEEPPASQQKVAVPMLRGPEKAEDSTKTPEKVRRAQTKALGIKRFADKIKTERSDSKSVSTPMCETPSSISRNASKKSGFVEKLVKIHHGQGDGDENKLRQRLVRFVNGPFDIIMIFFIFLNACCMFAQTEWKGAQAGHSLGLQETFWGDASHAFAVIDGFFIAIYTLEIIIRVGVLRYSFFWDRIGGIGYANLFDLSLIVVAYLDFLVASFAAQNLGVLRFLRMAKLARALRLVRVLKAFHQLRLLTFAIAASLPAFLWSMAILCVLNVIAGMILTQILNEYVMDADNDRATRTWVNEHYGSGMKASYTMFQATHSGCWPNYSTRLVEEVHPSFGVFWFFYVGAVIFAIIKIITAVFIGETMKAAQSDAVTAVSERMKASSEYITKLQDVFESADESGDGVLTKDEFSAMLATPTIKHYLAHLDIEVHDAEGLFDLLDDGDGCVTLSEFVSGVTRMKGQARSADMVSLMYDNKITHEQGKEVLRILHKMATSWDVNCDPEIGEKRRSMLA